MRAASRQLAAASGRQCKWPRALRRAPLAPLVGGIIGGVIYPWLSDEPHGQVVNTSA
jgi:hypothetical protein